jgi:hypothetical protein
MLTWMLDTTTKKILRLVQPAQPVEMRTAALAVLGEVGARDAEVTEVLSGAFDDADASVRAAAITAAGKLRIEQALPRLLDRVTQGGAEAELAAQAAARLGAKGTRALQDLMGKVAPGLRRRIASALAVGGTASAETAAVDALLDSDPGVVDAATRSLAGGIPALSEAHRRALADHLLEFLGNKKTRLAPASETAVVRLLAALKDARAEASLWERTLPAHPSEVRAAALQALGGWVSAPAKDRLKRLFTCAADADFRVAAPALLILQNLPGSDRAVSDWLTLVNAPDVAVRRAALEKVGDRDSAAVAAALLQQLDHSDRALREAALARLTRLEHGREALTEALLQAETPDRGWLLAQAQAPFVRDYPPRWRESVFKRAGVLLEAGDRRADALLFVLREADAVELRDSLEKRALALRKKKDYATALIYLRLLARDPACAASIRLELAACGLKVSARDRAAEAADPCLEQFARLVHSHEAEVLDFLKQTKWLEADELFYLGFHFAGKDGQERKFGGQVLQLLIARSPRSKLAQDAKRKLRSEGLD